MRRSWVRSPSAPPILRQETGAQGRFFVARNRVFVRDSARFSHRPLGIEAQPLRLGLSSCGLRMSRGFPGCSVGATSQSIAAAMRPARSVPPHRLPIPASAFSPWHTQACRAPAARTMRGHRDCPAGPNGRARRSGHIGVSASARSGHGSASAVRHRDAVRNRLALMAAKAIPKASGGEDAFRPASRCGAAMASNQRRANADDGILSRPARPRAALESSVWQACHQ